MYSIEYSGQFKKSVKRCKKRGLDLAELQKVIRLLAEKGTLPQEYKPHICQVNMQEFGNVMLNLIGFYNWW